MLKLKTEWENWMLDLIFKKHVLTPTSGFLTFGKAFCVPQNRIWTENNNNKNLESSSTLLLNIILKMGSSLTSLTSNCCLICKEEVIIIATS